MAAVEDQELDLGNSDVCTKYREAGRIANLAMQGIKTMVRTSTALRLKSLSVLHTTRPSNPIGRGKYPPSA